VRMAKAQVRRLCSQNEGLLHLTIGHSGGCYSARAACRPTEPSRFTAHVFPDRASVGGLAVLCWQGGVLLGACERDVGCLCLCLCLWQVHPPAGPRPTLKVSFSSLA
jgi:hypothetical protein